jgi:hypothetical protein
VEYAPFAAVDRQARAIDRKTWLKALTGSLAALAATRPVTTEAGKDAKKFQKKVKKKVKKACGKQVAQCEFHFAILSPDKISCCQFLRNCDFDGHIQCVV